MSGPFQTTTRYGLAPAADGLSSPLLADGAATGATVPGILLERQYADPAGDALLFLTYDSPFEERLEIVLFSRGSTADRLSIGVAYAGGVLGEIDWIAGDRCRFPFLTDTKWELAILPRPRFRLPFFGDPATVSRPLRLNSRLVIASRAG